MKITLLLVIVMLCCSCPKGGDPFNPPDFDHYLCISFQDASGNDLVKGIGFDDSYVLSGMGYPDGYDEENTAGIVKPELYTMGVIFGRECEDGRAPMYKTPDAIYDRQSPVLGLVVADGKYYLNLRQFSVKSKKCLVFERTISFKLTCPYVFGDDKEREIVTFWETNNVKSISCYRIKLGNQEITDIIHEFNGLHKATIILDR